ncbi:MAG: sugar ABC transporter permease [Caldilineaceae bacterium]|nr:sugar ABC transporter permease [Caldilineaceae bacterium]MBP8108250.1 sugar ABC transporter permease [Caldilineaceae bacterium]MBP8121659.1 sugar ABC transporter permease [Caldilineaceae bacterium]MBP9071641.1 sugar ABC transporter permease [Caldilineaceae bacterium]
MPGQRGWHKWKWVLLFLAPSALGLLLFVIYPIVSSLWYAFNDWNLLTPPRYIGLANFQELWTDNDFWSAFGYTVTMIGLYLPTVFVLGLSLALFLNQKLRGMLLVRTVSFMPVVASWVVVSIIWKWLFNPAYGLINYGLGLLGITGPAWLFDPTTAMFAIVITSVWKDVGYIGLLFLGGLQGISETYYEAARMDGAGRWRSLRSITIPLLTPTMFFVLITMLINYFQMFEQVWLMPMTNSAADRQLEVIVTEVVKNAFSYGRMGYASAMSWVLFLLIFAITFVQLRMQKRWVYYEGN